MSLLSLNLGAPPAFRGNPLENPAVPLSSGAAWMFDVFGAGTSSAGESVNEITAMQCEAVYACVNVLASDMSSLPLRVWQTTETGLEPAEDHDLYYLLGTEPNPEMTAPQFLSTWIGCAVLTGNGYAEIQRKGTTPVALWPFNPRYVKAVRAKGGENFFAAGVPAALPNDLVYEITVGGVMRRVAAKDMLHLPGISLDGWLGYNPIHAGRQTIGVAKAAIKFIGGFFGRGSRPSGLLIPTEQMKLGDPRIDQARKSWENANSGENQGRTAVMPYGWDWKQIGLTMDQAQFLEISQFTRTQIAGIFRVPPHMIGDTSRLSNNNHESVAQEYVTFTLRPWLAKIEAEIQRKLMPRLGRSAGKLTVKFDYSDLIKGDFASQMTGFATGRQWGFYSTNDVRRKLGENPIGPEGDMYLAPLNMVPLDKIGLEPTPDPAPNPSDGGGDDAKPQGNGGMNQQRLLDRMAQAYSPLFRDACGRLQARSKRDAEAVAQIFTPVLESIATEAQRQARNTFRLAADADLGVEKILRDCRKSIEKRAGESALDADVELQRSVKAITLGIFREAGSTLALAA